MLLGRSSVQAGVKVGVNARKRRSQARPFCNLAFPGLEERFFRWNVERTYSVRKDSFIHGMRSQVLGRKIPAWFIVLLLSPICWN